MKNFKLMNVADQPRVELHDALALTGSEMSINHLPAGGAVPFVHAHKQNEELYYVLSGKGELYIDGDVLPLKEGDAFRIDPAGKRAIRAAQDSALRYLCIQTKAGSLEGFTMEDGVILDEKAPWHQQ